ncbi:MAG: hypothetical protein WC622_15085 [Pedobacter sp.]|jgi:hypothetical protein|uniref:hypothetical protein n=1 Tax=Pedobacter sp. TaxID=1411316 RepID=UPI003567D5D1
MAIYNGKTLKGSFGNLTFAKHGEVNVVKSKIKSVKQSKATKKSASVFGKFISPFSKFIRQSFDVLINGNADSTMVNRMNSDISTLIYQHIDKNGKFNFNETSFNRLLDFDFNLASPLNNSLLIKPMVNFTTNNVEIIWPEFLIAKNLRFPVKAISCVVSFRFVHFCLAHQKWNVSQVEEIEIKKNQLSTVSQSFNLSMPAGSLFLFGVGITYFTGTPRIRLNSKTFNPAAICGVVFVPGSCGANEIADWDILPLAAMH